MTLSTKNVPLNHAIGVPFEELIVSGGDERLDLNVDWVNKYNVNPMSFEDVFNRASCTCSPFSPVGFEAAMRLYRDLETNVDFDEVRARQTDEFKRQINYQNEDRFDVFMPRQEVISATTRYCSPG